MNLTSRKIRNLCELFDKLADSIHDSEIFDTENPHSLLIMLRLYDIDSDKLRASLSDILTIEKNAERMIPKRRITSLLMTKYLHGDYRHDGINISEQLI